MITFKSLRWKNFLSTGENWSEVDLTAAKQTLVVGHNGAGKSTMLDALSFALFGRAHRNISKTASTTVPFLLILLTSCVFDMFR